MTTIRLVYVVLKSYTSSSLTILCYHLHGGRVGVKVIIGDPRVVEVLIVDRILHWCLAVVVFILHIGSSSPSLAQCLTNIMYGRLGFENIMIYNFDSGAPHTPWSKRVRWYFHETGEPLTASFDCISNLLKFCIFKLCKGYDQPRE